jgi:Flp pilus assembly protein TadD
MMNRVFAFPILCCLGVTLIASGCSQPPWNWGKSKNAATADAGAISTGAPEALPADVKPGDKTPKTSLALARLSERRGQIDQAERLYLDVIKKSPNNPVAYHRLGVLYAKRGKVKEAEENLSRALALKPDDPELLSDAGYFYYLASRPKEAEQSLRRALEISPGNHKYCTNLALVVGEQGRRDEAYTLFRRAGAETQATANMAFVLAQRGEYQEAMNLYNRALTEDTSMRVAADAMIELSKFSPDKPLSPTPVAPADGRPVVASNLSPATVGKGRPAPAATQYPVTPATAPPALAASDALVTVSDGRPVSAAGQFPPPPADGYAVPATSQDSSNRGNRGPVPSTGVPCAYAVQNDVVPRQEMPHGLLPSQGAVPSPSRIEAPRFPSTGVTALPPYMEVPSPARPVPAPSALHVAADLGNSDLAAPASQSTPTAWGPLDAPTASRPPFNLLSEPLALTMIAGIVLAGFGAVPYLLRRPASRAAVTARAGVYGEHRPADGYSGERRAAGRIRPIRRPAGRRRG